MTTVSSIDTQRNNKHIAIWLLLCCTVIFAMVVLGGVTRLTGSGLSMVQWRPIVGTLPPLSQQQWKETFDLYKQSPEFKHKNFMMNLGEFKSIFWVEYAHRLLGRSIAILFLLPMLYFIIRRKAPRVLIPKLITMFVLGGLQGLMGWYMVKSGLIDNPHVSQYRLAAHLGLAFFVYAFILWVALDLIFPRYTEKIATEVWKIRYFSFAITAIVFITVISGAFVAGLKAGLIFNTFPLMDGQWIPDGILEQTPLWKNFLENMITVQFDHRLLALSVFVIVASFWFIARRIELPTRSRLAINMLLGALLLQVSLGISTLLLHVPILLAAAHQAGAMLLFTASLYVTHSLMVSKS